MLCANLFTDSYFILRGIGRKSCRITSADAATTTVAARTHATDQIYQLLIADLSLVVALCQCHQHLQFCGVQRQFMAVYQAGKGLHANETGVFRIKLLKNQHWALATMNKLEIKSGDPSQKGCLFCARTEFDTG